MLNFNVPDELWKSIVPMPFQTRVICLDCLDKFASAKGIHYAEHLDEEICFVGEMAAFTLRVESINKPVCE